MERLPEPTPDEAKAAAKWWIEEREGWPLDRALRVWLAFERPYAWDPEDAEDAVRYDRWYDAALAAAR